MSLPNQLQTRFGSRSNGPVFESQENRFGGPAESYSHNSGPYYAGNGNVMGSKPTRDEALVPFFGMSKSGKEFHDPYDDYDIENYQLPDGFIGKRPYLSYLILKKLSTSDKFPYTEMAPFVRNDNTQTITWDVWKFNSHMLGRTPHESVSRLLTMNQTSSQEAMVRWGIALMLEHGFYLTPKGRENYRKNLEQISEATAVTLAHGAMFVVFNSSYTDPNNKYRNKIGNTYKQLGQRWRDELADWAIIQKTERGWNILLDKCKKTMRDRCGVDGNYAVVCGGIKKYIDARPENNLFIFTGVVGGQKTNTMPHDGITLRESVGYPIGEHQPNDDIAKRERTIGSFFHTLPTTFQHIPDSEWKTSMMDIDIMCEERNDWYRLRYTVMCTKLGIFDYNRPGDTKPLSPLGSQWFNVTCVGSKRTWGAYLRGCKGTSTNSRNTLFDRIAAQIAALPAIAHLQLLRLAGAQNTQRQQQNPPSQNPYSNGSMVGGMQQFGNQQLQSAQPASSSSPDNGGIGLFARAGQLFSQAEPNEAVTTVLGALNARSVQAHTNTAKLVAASGAEAVVKTEINSLNDVLLAMDKRQLAQHFTDKFTLTEELLSLIRDHTSLASTKSAKIKSLKELNRSALDVYVSNLCDLLERYDERDSLEYTRDHYEGSRSELEKLLTSDAFGESRSSTTASADTAAALRYEKDQMSPRWLIDGPDADLSKVVKLLTSSYSKKCVHLMNSSLAFTLSANHLVLFFMNQNQLDAHRAQVVTHESVALNIAQLSKMPSMASLARADERFTMLQFNATISALYCFLTQEVDKPKSAFDTPALLNEVRKLCPLRSPISGDHATYCASVISLFQSSTTPAILQCQNTMREAIGLLRTIALLVVTEKRTPSAAEAKANDANLTAAVGAFVKSYRPSFHRTHAVVHRVGGESNEAASLSTEEDYIAYKAFVDNHKGESASTIDAQWNALKVQGAEKLNVFITSMSGANNAKVRDMLNMYRPTLIARYRNSQSENNNARGEEAWNLVLKCMVAICIGSLPIPIPVNPRTSQPYQIEDVCRFALFKANDLWEDGCMTDPDVFKFVMTRCIEKFKVHVEETENVQSVIANNILVNSVNRLKGGRDMWDTVQSMGSGGDGSSSSSSSSSSKSMGSGYLDNVAQVKELLDAWAIENSGFLDFALDNNLLPMFGALGFRSAKRYLMGSMRYMAGYGEAAKTYYGFADFQLSDNVAQKMHYGHFTMYAKTVVLKPEKIVQANNIIVLDYNGGNNTGIWDPLDKHHVGAYRQNELKYDIFLLPTLPGYSVDDANFLDITGRFNAALGVDAETQMRTYYGPAAKIWGDVWGWRSVNWGKKYVSDVAPKFNTLCFQERQRYYSHSTKDWTAEVQNRGHFGHNVYPGSGSVANGGEMYFRPEGKRSVVISAT